MNAKFRRLCEAALTADRREGGSYALEDIEPILRAALRELKGIETRSHAFSGPRRVTIQSEAVTEVLAAVVDDILRE